MECLTTALNCTKCKNNKSLENYKCYDICPRGLINNYTNGNICQLCLG